MATATAAVCSGDQKASRGSVLAAMAKAATTDSTATFSFVATDADDAWSSLTSACSLDDSPFGACTCRTQDTS